MGDKNIAKQKSLGKRKLRVRKYTKGDVEKPRLVVFMSLNHIYAQLVDDVAHKTITGVSSLKGSVNVTGKKTEKAKSIGEAIAKKAIGLGYKKVVFDRSGYLYHGKVKALADAARKAGLEF